MALPLFSERLLDDLGLETFFDVHLFKPPIFVLKLFHARHERGVHAAVLAAPLVERGRAHAVLATKLWFRRAGLSLFKDRQDLAVGVAGFLHGNLLGSGYEKIPLLNHVNFREDHRFRKREPPSLTRFDFHNACLANRKMPNYPNEYPKDEISFSKK